MALGHFLNGFLYVFDSTFFPHFQSTVVSVSTCAVPVAWHRFGVKGYYDAEVFRHSVQNIPANPKIVTDGNAFTWTNLELPLAWHDLGVTACDFDPGV
eukprot:CAMPEP_0203744056 /NCGR_PEP_ID=MMETSP0098-20131031/261_1 /ASSEMBLY_ACC=CAM_ASM_000208 /TAXON_ID=96639 /ORGANISM=" , Strain NY0313808BC1" /LENGTH=97 /DNA_ID=CAMNT_0050631477 /DNA_START=358 /DNA_END=651 /DNA_ORIENTATION=+